MVDAILEECGLATSRAGWFARCFSTWVLSVFAFDALMMLDGMRLATERRRDYRRADAVDPGEYMQDLGQFASFTSLIRSMLSVFKMECSIAGTSYKLAG